MEQKKQIRRPRRKLTEPEIVEVLNEYRRSDMNVMSFCKKHDIVKGTFYNWMNKHQPKMAVTDRPQGFVPLTVKACVQKETYEEGILFAEVSLKGSISIKLFQQVSSCFLKELISPRLC